MHPYIGPALTTANFNHVEFKLPELARMARANSTEYQAAASAYYDGRWKLIARHVKSNPTIPQDVRDEAAKYSRELVFSLNVFKSKITRGQSHGSLDSSKLARLASPGLSVREFDRLAASAYRRREHVQAVTTRPRVAIVGDMCENARAKNSKYLNFLGRLAYVIAEAAKLSGVEVALYGSRGFRNAYRVHPCASRMARAHGLHSAKRPHVVATLKDWNGDVSGAEYSIFTDKVPGMGMAFPVVLFQGVHLLTGSANGMGSDCGAGGIEFARAQGANLVIAFGEFDANEKADLTFDPSDSVETVVRGIVAALNNRKAA